MEDETRINEIFNLDYYFKKQIKRRSNICIFRNKSLFPDFKKEYDDKLVYIEKLRTRRHDLSKDYAKTEDY